MAYKQCITNQSTIRVTAAYGSYPSGGYHGGLDTVHTNLQAFAPKSGTVVVAHTWQGGTSGNDSWGNYIVVSMGNNQFWLAGHLASQSHTVGEVINEGDFIGTQGRTGNVTGIHTHWEFWNGGQSTRYRTDPSTILRIPNAVGTYSVEWDTEYTEPGPEPPTPPEPPAPSEYNIAFLPPEGAYKFPIKAAIRIYDANGNTISDIPGTLYYSYSHIELDSSKINWKPYNSPILMNGFLNFFMAKLVLDDGTEIRSMAIYTILSKRNKWIYYIKRLE